MVLEILVFNPNEAPLFATRRSYDVTTPQLAIPTSWHIPQLSLSARTVVCVVVGGCTIDDLGHASGLLRVPGRSHSLLPHMECDGSASYWADDLLGNR